MEFLPFTRPKKVLGIIPETGCILHINNAFQYCKGSNVLLHGGSWPLVNVINTIPILIWKGWMWYSVGNFVGLKYLDQ